ncbi:MAG: hypothetical protein AB2705_19575 [Candidatus Thiodiazotropha sp.]
MHVTDQHQVDLAQAGIFSAGHRASGILKHSRAIGIFKQKRAIKPAKLPVLASKGRYLDHPDRLVCSGCVEPQEYEQEYADRDQH